MRMRTGLNPVHPAKAAAALALAWMLAGCAAPPKPAEPKVDPAAQRLSSLLATTESLSPATASADAAQQAAKPATKAQAMRAERMSLAFAGHAADMLRPLAAARGLTFKVVGPQPHLPLFVVVDQKDATFEEVLRDVAAQFGQRAQLALTDTAVEIRYRTNLQ